MSCWRGYGHSCGTCTLPPRLLAEDFFYHGVTCSPSRLAFYATLYCGLAILQGLHSLELPGKRRKYREGREKALSFLLWSYQWLPGSCSDLIPVLLT
jgi:hypothetical protein